MLQQRLQQLTDKLNASQLSVTAVPAATATDASATPTAPGVPPAATVGTAASLLGGAGSLLGYSVFSEKLSKADQLPALQGARPLPSSLDPSAWVASAWGLLRMARVSPPRAHTRARPALSYGGCA